ncbi:MAG: hypothetical protein A3J63_05090 [Candidatus Moranbacteria bacterium RIFCSPHIGHO2_02_FULL_40_12b]|nr:MAG: hypothetical protein A3J63_05090 [Candidatus Moranbacteria bacterium RIFCSPHIGHO2_02_FULL_40_12b]OGI23112.1 MAG: hypothetical protein A3E91_03715 [Candidatus Moranbacteria bacterium RIFCSPHIGHO2_12_FULL_40_10]
MRDIEIKIIKKLKGLRHVCNKIRQTRTIILTTGAYDIMHKGHILYLNNAKELGDILIVGINDDCFTRKIKGPGRPYNNQESRALVVASIVFVDFVYIFGISEDVELIHAVRPHIFVMSSSSHRKPESRQHQINAVIKHGGKIKVFKPFYRVHSSDIIKKMKKS